MYGFSKQKFETNESLNIYQDSLKLLIPFKILRNSYIYSYYGVLYTPFDYTATLVNF